MKAVRRILLILLLGPTGCSMMENTAHNVFSAPVDIIDNFVFQRKLRSLARSALEKIETEQGKTYCYAYAKGFKDGFVDYIDRNGSGSPPAMPPFHLQRAALRYLEKQDDMNAWFAGFRHGASVAQASGLRERVVIPIALPPYPVKLPLYHEKSESQSAPGEELPIPRRMDQEQPATDLPSHQKAAPEKAVPEKAAPAAANSEPAPAAQAPPAPVQPVPAPPLKVDPAPPLKVDPAPLPGPASAPAVPRPLPKEPAVPGPALQPAMAPPPGLVPTHYLPPPPEPPDDPNLLPTDLEKNH